MLATNNFGRVTVGELFENDLRADGKEYEDCLKNIKELVKYVVVQGDPLRLTIINTF